MSRKKEEINPIRGKRLKQLLSERGINQKDFAKKIGYSKEHLSYIINGKRSLTEDAADAIIKLFPDVKIEWLLGYSPFKTDRQRLLWTFADNVVTKQQEKEAFSIYAGLAGFNISVMDESPYQGLSIEDFLESTDEDQQKILDGVFEHLDDFFYIFSDKDGVEKARISARTYNSVVKEIAEFADFKIKKICNMEALDNG